MIKKETQNIYKNNYFKHTFIYPAKLSTKLKTTEYKNPAMRVVLVLAFVRAKRVVRRIRMYPRRACFYTCRAAHAQKATASVYVFCKPRLLMKVTNKGRSFPKFFHSWCKTCRACLKTCRPTLAHTWTRVDQGEFWSNITHNTRKV